MNSKLADPLVIICAVVLLIGFAFMVWAIGKLRKKPASNVENDLDLAPESPVNEMPFMAPQDRGLRDEPVSRAPLRPATPVAPAANPAATKEVADRLDLMSQRLADMQDVLSKQAASATPQIGAAPGGPLGQGFSPETVDKLLKIIGNVIQQVDVLQKNLDLKPAAPAASSAPKLSPTPAVPPAAGQPGSPSGLRGGGGPITGPQTGLPKA